MLTASVSAPNTRQQCPKPVPTPDNWFGVTGGMQAAKTAISNGDLAGAEQILTDMLEFAPAEMAGWKLLARVQRKLGHIESGIESAKRALQLQNSQNHNLPPVSATLAKLLWQQDEREQAKEMLATLISRQPEDHSLIMLKEQWDKESNA